jgi:2-polyprenyl-3-methyl-5-hydroxy-6-metoxy-1,4-benzoquinol methylase
MATELTDTKKLWFQKIRKDKKKFIKNQLIIDYCRDKKILDVGCVGQDIDYNNPEWIHSKVKAVSESLTGVDINEDGIVKLNNMGYNIVHYNNLNISNRFDMILMLDVIEHVDNPVKFIKDYEPFLNDNGKIIITTPNSNRAINFINILFKNDYSLNYEHTFWFCPKTLMEVFNRVDTLKVDSFYWLEDYLPNRNLNWKYRILYLLDKILVKLRSNFSHNFMFVLEKKR